MNVLVECVVDGELMECATFNFVTETRAMGDWIAEKAFFYGPGVVPVFTINFGVNIDMTVMPVLVLGAAGNC